MGKGRAAAVAPLAPLQTHRRRLELARLDLHRRHSRRPALLQSRKGCGAHGEEAGAAVGVGDDFRDGPRVRAPREDHPPILPCLYPRHV